MPAARFFVEQALSAGARVTLPASVAHHARNVLRLRAGDPIVLFNGTGGEYRARLASETDAAGGAMQAKVDSFDPIEREARLRITLIQALATSDKIDWVIEKAVEIGVARVIVTGAARSTARLEGARLQRRLQHWHELVVAACCQCGRNRVIAISIANSLADALEQAGQTDFKWVLDAEASAGLPATCDRAHEVTLAVGPEGGFERREIEQAVRSGYQPISLGPRILRTESAGLVAAAAWLALNGEFAAAPVG